MNSVLTIQVPSQFFYEWLEEHYVNVLKKAIDAVLGSKGKLEYSIIVDNGNEHNKPLSVRLPGGTSSGNPNGQRNGYQGHDPKGLQIKNPFQIETARPANIESHLNPQYQFASYIEGDCNRLARSAGMAIAKKPGTTAFNPFVVYGGVGLGKTHLAQAIGNQIKTQRPESFVLYVTSDRFTTQFIEAVRENAVQEFTNFYLQIDVLIIDDIQFMAGKEKTQENFFHIFNHLHQAGKQIIMTSDQAPKDISGLQERLLSRFKWGLTADIQAPDFETRLAIIQHKAMGEGIYVPENVIEYLAHAVETNIRELEGVLVSLIAKASLMRKEIDLDLAKATLLNIIRTAHVEVDIEYIQDMVADYFNVSIKDLKSQTRKKEVAEARQIAMYLTQHYTEMTLKNIGSHFGGRDHSTVVHASRAVAKKSESDSVYKNQLDELEKQVQNKTNKGPNGGNADLSDAKRAK